MHFRILLLLPLCIGAAFLAGTFLFDPSSPALRSYLRVEIELVKILAMIGCGIAAFRFEKGAYLRKAWLLIGSCMALLLIRDLTLLDLGLSNLVGVQDLVRSFLVVLANISLVMGYWLLAQAWKVAQLNLPGTQSQRLVIVLVSILIAGMVAGPSVVDNLFNLLAADYYALTGLASSLGDIICLCLIAPLLLTALALRGGLIGWPWLLLVVSLLAWLFYDGILVVGPLVGMASHATSISSEIFRTMACMYTFSAGMAQCLVLKQIRQNQPA